MRPQDLTGADFSGSLISDAYFFSSTLTKEQQEYLDSSHILPPGRDALDTRAEEWRKNQRK